jgi:hypothetical protein
MEAVFMRKNDPATSHASGRALSAVALRAAALGLVALGASACVIVIPPPRRTDPFQPPTAQAKPIRRNATHRIRLECGQRQVFQTAWTGPEQVQIEYQGKNLSPRGQVHTASARLQWGGPGGRADVPVYVGDANQRDTKGTFGVTGDAGNHTLELSMADNRGECGPVNFTLTFR